MKTILFIAAMLGGCASLGGQNQLTPQGEAAILALIQIATGQALGAGGSVCSQLSVVQPTNLAPCAAPVSQSQADLANAFAACAAQTAIQIEYFKIQQRLCPAPPAPPPPKP